MLEIIDCDQNTDAWKRARMGIPTASAFSDVLAKGEGKTRRTYMLKLAGEIITGEPSESFKSVHMERGHEWEPEARDLYCFETGSELRRVGFIRNGRAGASPDALIGEDGGLEIKTQLPHLLIETILKGSFPPEHKAQVQGTLWLTSRKWWDLVVYGRGLPMFKTRAYRDEGYIANLAGAVSAFNDELDLVVKTIRSHNGTNTLMDDLRASA